jgi:protease YdgD
MGATVGSAGLHREAVDETRFPWSAIGKLFNESGGECSGVVISRDQILTAAHCLFNYKSRRFVASGALHFLIGYRTGDYSFHARIASYEIGAGFDPLRYEETSESDWTVLTTTEELPAAIEPLQLSRMAAPSGTKAVLAGYPQDRAHAMTVDRNCEMRESVDMGRLQIHTCRGIKGYSGAPILVNGGTAGVLVAGIQIAMMHNTKAREMLAIPAQAIWRIRRQSHEGELQKAIPGDECLQKEDREGAIRLTDIRLRLGLNRFELTTTVAAALLSIDIQNRSLGVKKTDP